MSKADEMFEKLGYERINTSMTTIKYIKFNKVWVNISIRFDLKDKTVFIHCETENLTMQELQAINLKCKELGWIE